MDTDPPTCLPSSQGRTVGLLPPQRSCAAGLGILTCRIRRCNEVISTSPFTCFLIFELCTDTKKETRTANTTKAVQSPKSALAPFPHPVGSCPSSLLRREWGLGNLWEHSPGGRSPCARYPQQSTLAPGRWPDLWGLLSSLGAANLLCG